MNKRQKKKLFKKRSAFYPHGGPDAFFVPGFYRCWNDQKEMGETGQDAGISIRKHGI